MNSRTPSGLFRSHNRIGCLYAHNPAGYAAAAAVEFTRVRYTDDRDLVFIVQNYDILEFVKKEIKQDLRTPYPQQNPSSYISL